MVNKEKMVKAGKLISVEKGEYSDYTVIGFFVALQDFYPMKKLSKYLEKHQDQKRAYAFKEYQFLSYLISAGLLLEIDYGTLFLGTYGTCEDVAFNPGPEN